MKDIIAFEEAIKNQVKDLRAIGINPTIFWAYRVSRDVGNELIDFAEVIWDRDVEDIVRVFRENGITEFTISTGMSSIIETLALFESYGCKIGGLTKVNARYDDIMTGKKKVIPALRMCL